MSPQYKRPGSAPVIGINDVVLITTPQGTTHASNCGCNSCSGGGAVTGAQGTQGVRGPQGTQGVQGPAGVVETIVPFVSFEYTQGSASNSWTINHNLGFKPNVTVVDSAGNIMEGEITYTNSNSLTVSFSAGFSGKAYLS